MTKRKVRPSTAKKVGYIVVDENGTPIGNFDSISEAEIAVIEGVDKDQWEDSVIYGIYSIVKKVKVTLVLEEVNA